MVQLCLPFGCLFLAVSELSQGMTQIFISPYIDYAIHGWQMFQGFVQMKRKVEKSIHCSKLFSPHKKIVLLAQSRRVQNEAINAVNVYIYTTLC